ncbi:ABC-F family ATP-binding cassette domain-containing protein [Nocardiopsis sp. CNT-189]|uniref:ATP-binding cassette domain-containing protein n=1 Tax=Nocardiopsis oceanisediminis TaxID=2816862 RepID=UPI003B30EC35
MSNAPNPAHAPHAAVLTGVGYAWPDGTPVFDRLDAVFETGRTGLIGRNGSGKSTLLKLVSGALRPEAGAVSAPERTGLLDQSLPLDTGRTVAGLLGIAPALAGLRAIEAGDASEANFAAVGDDWDIEERALAQLARFGIALDGPDPLGRTVGTLSGGEAVLAGIAGLILRRPALTLLDEPTNNLDRRARELLCEAVGSWPGALVVVSHDRELLDRMDRIAELRGGRIRMWGGGYTHYTERLAEEQEAARRAVRAAEAGVRKEKRQLAEARIKLDRRVRYGSKMYETKREPKVVMKQRKRDAQVAAGKHRIMQEARLEGAREELTAAEEAVRDDDAIRIALPGTEAPAGQDVLVLAAGERGLHLRGPERIALTGGNGTGKTTLLRAVVAAARGGEPPVRPAGTEVVRVTSRVGYLPQRLDLLDDRLSVLENVRAAAPSASPQAIRAGLARFLIRGDRADLPAGALSGGERFRVALARVLLADTAPRLLILDEPTNSLDLDSAARLTEALSDYRGALLVASHDEAFLRDIGTTRRWRTRPGLPPEDSAGAG